MGEMGRGASAPHLAKFFFLSLARVLFWCSAVSGSVPSLFCWQLAIVNVDLDIQFFMAERKFRQQSISQELLIGFRIVSVTSLILTCDVIHMMSFLLPLLC